MRTSLIFGPPGTGKTTKLLGIVEEALQRGTPPDRIAYMGFTRKAANEAASRAMDKFNLSRDDLPWFRTLHSAAFRKLGLSRNEVMQTKHYKDLGSDLGLTFNFDYDDSMERVPIGGALGDRCLRAYSLSRARMVSLDEEHAALNDDTVPLWLLREFVQSLRAYKRRMAILDFCDMVDDCRDVLNCELFIIDEAQDLTNQQWELARRLGRDAKQVVIGGDDDQAIFEWAGAEVSRFQKINGERSVLPVSYRLPQSIYDITRSVGNQIERSVPKVWEPAPRKGTVSHILDIDELDLSQGSWLFLCRHLAATDWMAKQIREKGYVYQHRGEWSNAEDEVRAAVVYEKLRHNGHVSYHDAANMVRYIRRATLDPALKGTNIYWHSITGRMFLEEDWMQAFDMIDDESREYIRTLRANNESLTRPGRISISTIHAAKGGEAENVVLMSSANRRVRIEVETNPDPERRVWYVGLSRAKENLFILQGPEDYSYDTFLKL